jgi:pyruvate-formate lyase-activating enzyme
MFALEEFSVYDGPGIRSTVFLKGCPLRCVWCHNPEGQNTEPEILRSPNGCLGCNACIRCARVQNGKTVYTKFEDDQCIEEETFYEGGKTKKRYSKFHKETFINEYKFIMDNGEMRYYILSSEGDFGYRKYTYVDESSTYLVRLEAYMNEYDEQVIWELNGTECNDTMNNVISLERTINGKTKFYTKDEIPWGTGMVYPPHFQHELRN